MPENCTNCHGTGKIIWKDPKTGKPKSINCGACGGSGEKKT
jgi:DnaJ-class molecular chaperone